MDLIPHPGKSHMLQGQLSPGATTTEPSCCSRCSLRTLEPGLRNKRGHSNEKPTYCNQSTDRYLTPHTQSNSSHSVVSDSLWPYGLYSSGILQARVLEWVVFPFSRGSSQPRDHTQVSRIAGRFFINWAIREAQDYMWDLRLNKAPRRKHRQYALWHWS